MATQTLSNLNLRHFEQPDEVRIFEKGHLELLHFGDHSVGRVHLEPGWRWSSHVKPLAGTEFCEVPHFQYVISGQLHVVTSDGREFDARAGDCFSVSIPHDAWVVGKEPFIAIDWAGMQEYARSAGHDLAQDLATE